MRFFDRLRRPPIQPTDFPCFEDRPKTRQNVQVEQLRGALRTVQPLASSNRQLSVGMDSSLLFLINAFRIDHYSTTSIFREKIFCSFTHKTQIIIMLRSHTLSTSLHWTHFAHIIMHFYEELSNTKPQHDLGNIPHHKDHRNKDRQANHKPLMCPARKA